MMAANNSVHCGALTSKMNLSSTATSASCNTMRTAETAMFLVRPKPKAIDSAPLNTSKIDDRARSERLNGI